MTSKSRLSSWLTCGTSSERDRRNQLQVAFAIIAWALLYAINGILIKREILPPGAVSWLVGSTPMIAGLFVLLAYVRFLRETDELQRLVQLQGMAIGFGGAFFFFAGYSIFELLGAPEADFNQFITVTCVLYSLGTIFAWRRYR